MLAISLTQPWCTLVVRGIKPVENRSQLFSALLGQTFGLHASAKWDAEGAAWIEQHWSHRPDVMDVLRGPHRQSALLGIAHANGYLEGQRYWHHAEKRWVRAGDVEPVITPGCTVGGLIDSAWYFGKDPNHKQKYGLVLEDQRELARPVTCKGALGCWHVPPALEEDMAEQLGGRPWA